MGRGTQSNDGSAGDADYGAIGGHYSQYRQPEPRIAALIIAALGKAESVLNVGAGAGSYEPTDRQVTAVEPSASMRGQRPPHLCVAINATAESLPFADRQFDASMATFTIHQWRNVPAGLAEMRRVTRGPVVILSCNPNEVQHFWLNDYAPEVLTAEARRYPSIAAICEGLRSRIDVQAVPIPLNCKDGFNEAYYGRPEMLLDPRARQSCSAWSLVPETLSQEYVRRLHAALSHGHWDEQHRALRTQPEFTGSLNLIVSDPT